MNTPIIEPVFAEKIAFLYIHLYKNVGFREATAYLDRITGDNVPLRELLVDLIRTTGAKQ